ncbi:hypothetical protein KAF25_005855 [Fusarium avenaceum]|uniref:Uncharacterized protein n=1 Tax=Fusarium avenaceum TaxID=40199 RepID=A0A9P7KLQ3_9HYPO|nr:hypothetical protein KAF25_005855 [Fusarium avenaceum]
MKIALFFSALLSGQVLAIPEPDSTVVKDGEYTYTGIYKVRALQVDHIILSLILFYRDFWPSAVSKLVAIASQSAAGQAQTAPQANASVLGTMVAGHAVVVACSASQDLAQEYAGLSRYGEPMRTVTSK